MQTERSLAGAYKQAEKLFEKDDPPPPPIETPPPNDQDKKCEDRIANADRIMRALVIGSKSSYELQDESGLSEADVRNAIHYLRKQVHPAFVDVLEAKDTVTGKPLTRKYFLTEFGRKALPAPPDIDWNSPDVDPRKTKSPSGYTHIKGLVGKVKVNGDGSISLRGMKGKVYDTIKAHPCSISREIIEYSGVDSQVVWNTLTKLVEVNLVEYKMMDDGSGREARHYFIPGFEGKKASAPEPKTMVTKNDLDYLRGTIEAAPKKEPPEVEITKQPDDALSVAVKELRNTFDDTDIVLTVLSLMDQELNELRTFKTLIKKIMPDLNQ